MLILVSLLLGSLGAWFISRYAFRFGLIDLPNGRSSHSLPTPRGGGIGMLAALLVSSLVLKLPLPFWLPAALLAVISFFDDRLGLTSKTRLLFQFVAALAAAAPFFSAHQGAGGEGLYVAFVVLASCIYLAGTANFYNFMDGINGIAGITGAVGFCLLGIFTQRYVGNSQLGILAFCLSASCIGFLPFNMPKARVFMGDVGSVLLGFMFAVFVVTLSRDVTDFLVLAGFLSTFYADGLTTLYLRKRDGECLSLAHRRHLYQLFTNQKRIPHWQVAVWYGTIQSLIGLLLFAIRPRGVWTVAAVELILLALWCLVMQKVRRAVEDKPVSGMQGVV